ncbi:hypothetical protein JW998_09545 [candidate division KSB1 bacterium]|nr:hypothetical protein [candidate division KSB1 bacterium]
MKRFGFQQCALLVLIGLLFLISGVNDARGQNMSAGAITDLQQFVEQSRANALSIPVDPEVPPIELLKKPVFTTGDTLSLFWNGLDNPQRFTWGTVPLSDCLLELEASLDSTFSDIVILQPSPAASDSSKSFQIPANWIGQKIYYRGILYVKKGNSGVKGDPEKAVIVSSTQDMIKPTLDAFEWIDKSSDGAGEKNGWYRTDSLEFRYSGLSDLAGIFTDTLKYDTLKYLVHTYVPKPDGNPGPRSVSGSFDLSAEKLSDGEHDYGFSARDAGYSHASHGPGSKLAELWQIKGIYAGLLASGVIKIDRQAPLINMDNVRSVYSSPDTVADGSIVLTVNITDALSGVDENSISVSFSPALDHTFLTEKSQGVCTVIITVRHLAGKDSTSTLTVTASDSAGNGPVQASKKIDFFLKAPELISFRMADLNIDTQECLSPHVDFTDSTWVLIDSLDIAPHPRPVVSLQICGDSDRECVTEPWPETGTLKFDWTRVVTNDKAFNQVVITINAIDALGNAQKNGPADTLVYDIETPEISVTVRDTSAWEGDKPGRYGAYPFWTNDRDVLVKIESEATDLYKIHQTKPTEECLEAAQLSFYYRLPDSDSPYEFSYQANDSAGNASLPASFPIKLDTTIPDVDSNNFSVSDTPGSPDSVNITYYDPNRSIPDLSRFVVNNNTYTKIAKNPETEPVRYTVTVPENPDDYIVSLIDFAGNETDTVRISRIPTFAFVLFDTDIDSTDSLLLAQAKYTNAEIVAWQPDPDSSKINFDWAKITQVIFYNESEDVSIVWKPGMRKLLDLEVLYGNLSSGKTYPIKAKPTVKSWPEYLPPWPSDSIIFDVVAPEITSLAVKDTIYTQWPAEDGFTNDLDVQLTADVAEVDSSPIDSMLIYGDVKDSLFVLYKKFKTIRLTETENSAAKKIFCQIRDQAGNWSDSIDESIHYVVQTIINHTDDEITIKESEIDTNNIAMLPVKFSCPFPEFIWKVVTVDTAIPENEAETDTLACEKEGDHYICKVKFKFNNSMDAIFKVTFVDSAGNCSEPKIINVDVVEEPRISLTLFDYATFPKFDSPTSVLPDTTGVNSKFTSEVKPDSLVAFAERIRGDWSYFKYSFVQDVVWDTVKTNKYKIADTLASIYLIRLPKPQNLSPMDSIICYVRIENSLGVFTDDADMIIYDSVAPTLEYFRGTKNTAATDFEIVSDSLDYEITFKGYDLEPGQLDSLIITESVLDVNNNPVSTRETLVAYESSPQNARIRLLPDFGYRKLTAVLVDRANHRSGSISFPVRLNPLEVANFPNPFNPSSGDAKMRQTNLIFPLKDDSKVKITILDPFGNLVNEWDAECIKDLNSGDTNEDLRWDGTNAKGDPVASGGYICIIDALDTGERHMRKIAVIKE